MNWSNLQVKDLAKLNLQELSSSEVVLRIEELSQDEQYLSEPMSAREFYETLSETIQKYAPQINGTEIYNKLEKVAVSLMWNALSALDKKIKAQILNDNLLFALKNKVNILENIDSYLYVFEYGVGPDMEERRILSRSLDQNQERLGPKPIILKVGGEVSPTISNWLKDFVSFYNPTAYKGESYELAHYLYSSSNVKILNAGEKELLTRVISIYLRLRHPSYFPKIVGGPGDTPVKPLPKLPPVPKVPVSAKPVAPAPIVKDRQTLAAPPDKVGYKTEFDQKLAAAGVAHGASLSSLRARITERTIAENKAVSQKTPVLTPAEIKREINTPELPNHQMEKMVSGTIPASPAKVTFIAPKTSITNINVIEDLKKLEIGNLREGNLADQIRLIRNKVGSLAEANNLLPFYVVEVLEQSPLFKAYLEHGVSRVREGVKSTGLTQEEFEALADLRKNLGRL